MSTSPPADPLDGENSQPSQESLVSKYQSIANRSVGQSGESAISPRPVSEVDVGEFEGGEPNEAEEEENEESKQSGDNEADGDGEFGEEVDGEDYLGESDAEDGGDVGESPIRRSHAASDDENENPNESEQEFGDDGEEGDPIDYSVEDSQTLDGSDYEEESRDEINEKKGEREMPAILNQFINEEEEQVDALASDEEEEEKSAGEFEDGETNENFDADNSLLMKESERDDVRTIVDLQRAREEREHLIEVSKARQRAVAAILEKEKLSKARSFQGGLGIGEVDQSRSDYANSLDQLSALWAELERKREEAESKIDALTARLDSSDEKSTELAQTFKQFKREIAKEARNSRTNKPIKLKRILAFESEEERRDREIAEQRLKHIHMINEIGEMERAMKEKEKLAEGLHLIDFEQLKIENQTLNEKIEERNDELHKLRKKTTTTVQVLTHIKEKLTFIRAENQELINSLMEINGNVNEAREALTEQKKIRDSLRAENLILKQKQGFIGSDLLVTDFEQRKGDIVGRKKQLKMLKMTWANHQQIIERAKAVQSVIEEKKKMRELFPGSGTFVATTKAGAGAFPSIAANEGNFFNSRGFQGHRKFGATAAATIKAKK